MILMIMIMVMMITDPGYVLVDNPVTYQRDIVATGYDDDHDCNDDDS